MKHSSSKKALAWLLNTIIFFSPTLAAFQEGVVIDEDDFPTLQLIEHLDQIETPFGAQAKEQLYDIGEKMWLFSQKSRLDNAVQGLQDFDQLEFQELITAITNYHAFLDQSYEDGIPQTEAALYSALRNREYADRFALPSIGIAGLGAGYGSAVVRSRMMTRFIELLGLSALGYAGKKLEKAAVYTLIGILASAFLGTIFYHWRKYNKLYTEKQKNKLERKLTTKHDKKIKQLEQDNAKSLKIITKQLNELQVKQGKTKDDLTSFKQNIAGQLQTTQTNQNSLQEQYGQLIASENSLIESLNQAWGAIALTNMTGTEKINQAQLSQIRMAGAEALRLFDKQIKENNSKRKKFFRKITLKRRKSNKSLSPLLPLTPRDRSSSLSSFSASSSLPVQLIALNKDNSH